MVGLPPEGSLAGSPWNYYSDIIFQLDQSLRVCKIIKKQDEICPEASNSFHDSSVQLKVVTSEKKLLDAISKMVLGDQISIDSLHLGTMHVKRCMISIESTQQIADSIETGL